jgi:preprotein translocase subunit SecE
MQKLIKFLKEVAVEFKNISWPKKETLIQLTVVVISISLITSLILGGFDYIFTNSISLLGQLNQKPKANIEQVETQPIPSITATESAAPINK